MNRKQRIVLFLTAVALIIAFSYPPFQLITARGSVLNLGYGFLFDPPMYSSTHAGSVNVSLLAIELLAILIVGGILTLTFKDAQVSQT